MLDTVREQTKNLDKIRLTVMPPDVKLENFLSIHSCHEEMCNCSQVFVDNFMMYTDDEINLIEEQTRGQSANENWHRIRKSLLTASNFKKIVRSRDGSKTAEALIKGSSFKEGHVPSAIEYGIKKENIARKLFLAGHKADSKICSRDQVVTTGLVLSKKNNILACSPDGILNCHCGQYLIEIKCIYSYKNYHPLNAARKRGILYKDEHDNVKIIDDHPYYFQIQGQMGVCGMKSCILVLFTDKGIETIHVPFNQKFWDECEDRLINFYHTYFFNALKNVKTTSDSDL